MKKVVRFISVLLLMLIFGVSGANAQSMGPGEHGMMQDCRMGGGAGMMHNMQGGAGMMGGMMMGHMRMMPEDLMEARHHVMGMMMGLGLDDKQMSAIQKIIDTTVKEMIRKRSDLLIAKIDLEGILHKEPVDLNAAETQMKRIEAMKTDMFISHLKALEEVKSLLSPEQKGRLKEMMQTHMMGGMEMTKDCDCSMPEGKNADDKVVK
jgi:Spy/CpxP family protein refolding chaperone